MLQILSVQTWAMHSMPRSDHSIKVSWLTWRESWNSWNWGVEGNLPKYKADKPQREKKVAEEIKLSQHDNHLLGCPPPYSSNTEQINTRFYILLNPFCKLKTQLSSQTSIQNLRLYRKATCGSWEKDTLMLLSTSYFDPIRQTERMEKNNPEKSQLELKI